MMTERKRTAISDDIKAAALADLVLMSPAAVAAKYGLKRNTVNAWKSLARPTELLLRDEGTALISIKRERIGVLALEYLEASLNAQIAQAYVSSDPNYINRQSAGELAVLHGVLNDKSIRLLEALQPRASDASHPTELSE